MLYDEARTRREARADQDGGNEPAKSGLRDVSSAVRAERAEYSWGRPSLKALEERLRCCMVKNGEQFRAGAAGVYRCVLKLPGAPRRCA